MVHDRTAGHDLYLTHAFMAVMLGMRRPWVTETLHSLEAEGHIRAARGKVAIVDRAGLMAEETVFTVKPNVNMKNSSENGYRDNTDKRYG
jgi:DNA-binding FadR family transcriptional regulator